jgi:Glyoxalase-like domain
MRAQVLVDHLIYAVPDLATGVAEAEKRFGVRAQPGGRHVSLGTHNALLALGPRTYLEIIAADPGQPAPPGPRPFGVEGITRGGLAGWAIAADNIDAAVAQSRRYGYDPGDVIEGQRTGPTGTVLRWRATPFARAGHLIPFLICWGDTDHPARSAPSRLVLRAVEIEHPDPSSLRLPLAAVGAEVEVKPATAPALVAHLQSPNGRTVLR